MARKRHTPDQILAKLRDADVLLAQGASLADVIRKLEVSEQMYRRSRNQYGGMNAEEVKRLVADQALDIRLLKDIAEGNF